MCGVAAILGHEQSIISSMVDLMEHRGIRSSLSFPTGASIGHVRLPIVGVGPEHDQPVTYGRWTIAFVGEILDFRENFPDEQCDLGVAVDSWIDHGPRGLNEFDGFWHLVAYDSLTRELHGVVDYLSQKPLYYRDDYVMKGMASEITPLLAGGRVTPDLVYLSDCVKWGYCPDQQRTPYSEIRKALPGEWIVLREGEDRRSQIVDQLYPRTIRDPSILKAEIIHAIRRRVTSSDVPVACLVSGGLDSSIVYSQAVKFGDVRPYYVDNGEWEYCQMIAPNATCLSYQEVSQAEGIDYLQEPIDLGSLLPQVALSKAIAQNGRERVCLTGDGADEMFGGYGRAARYDSQASDVWRELVMWHLPRLDRVMMRNKIEVRSPFLARNVVEIALGTPYEERIGKKILKDLFRNDLPPEIVDRQKRPLRTKAVEEDREGRSNSLVKQFMKTRWS